MAAGLISFYLNNQLITGNKEFKLDVVNHVRELIALGGVL
jgi:hypothetical protein